MIASSTARIRLIVTDTPTVDEAGAKSETADGLVRIVPAGAQLIEFRRAIAGDFLLIETVSGIAGVIVHAHLGG